MKMKFYLSKIKFSKKDVKDGVKIPKKLTLELAELLGIIIGDGHISDRLRKDRNSERVYEIDIYGNIKDKKYYSSYINGIIFRLFNIRFAVNFRIVSNLVRLSRNSKAIHSFLKHNFELPSSKDNAKVPEIIMLASKEKKAAFLRGYFETDGCFVVKYKPNSYPVVQAASKSQQLIKGICELLADLQIISCTIKEVSYCEKRNKTYVKYCLFINGRKRVEKYMKKIGFSNENKVQKYRKFMKNEPH
jgi:intein/homing endonuclease